MPLIIPANTLSGGYEVANSCRFDDGSSAYMHKTPSSAGSSRKITFSCWYKKSQPANGTTWQQILNCSDSDGNPYFAIGLKADKFTVSSGTGSTELQKQSTQVLRDPSAWYHLCVSIDTTDGTAGDRVKMYINGTRVTSFAASTDPSLNYDFPSLNTTSYAINIGRDDYGGGEAYLDGYLAETVFIDGTAYAASSFGEFDEDSPQIWKPIDVSGLTFGFNGFYLDFEDSANLGNDKNGGTDLTEVNLAATDQSTDTPTNNFSTLNPAVRSNNITFAEANLKITGDGSANFSGSHGTIAVNNGKWYCEVKVTDAANLQIGALIVNSSSSGDATGTGSGGMYYYYENIYWQDNNTAIKVANSPESGANASVTGGSNSVNTFTTNDIISMALDMDNGRIYFAKNGTWENSGNPASGTNAFSLPTNYNDGNGMTFYASLHSAAAEINFGNPTFSISSGNADANGYGNFEYAVPSGFYALCTKNLAEFG